MQEISHALQPYLGRNVSSSIEQKLTNFLNELIALRNQEMQAV